MIQLINPNNINFNIDENIFNVKVNKDEVKIHIEQIIRNLEKFNHPTKHIFINHDMRIVELRIQNEIIDKVEFNFDYDQNVKIYLK